jgi:hypothetical protein
VDDDGDKPQLTITTIARARSAIYGTSWLS